MENQRYKVVMIPTNESTTLFLDNEFLWQINEPDFAVSDSVNIDLHIVDVEATIVYGDSYLFDYEDGNFPQLCYHSGTEVFKIYNRQKVVASTNTSLDLPIIPDKFTEIYSQWGKQVENIDIQDNCIYWTVYNLVNSAELKSN